MTKEEVALKLSIEAIKHFDKTDDINSLSKKIYQLYNELYKNLDLPNSPKPTKLEDLLD